MKSWIQLNTKDEDVVKGYETAVGNINDESDDVRTRVERK
jgi:hypothetical protein